MSSRGHSRGGRGYFGRETSSSRHRDDYRGSDGYSSRDRHRDTSEMRHRDDYHSSRGPPPRDERYGGRGSRGSRGGRGGYDRHHPHSPPPHPRRPPSPPHPRRILSKLAPDEQMALTKALVETVLRDEDGYRPSRGYRDDGPPRRDDRYRDDGRGDYRDRRPGFVPRFRGRGMDRGGFRGRGRGAPRGRYEATAHERLGPRRRPLDHDDDGPPLKRARVNSEVSGERLDKRKRRDTDKDTDEEDELEVKKDQKDNSGSEDEAEDGDKKDKEDDDGEKPVSNGKERKTEVKAPARVKGDIDERDRYWDKEDWQEFGEYQCPHCPSHTSTITLQDYKRHLGTQQHKKNMEWLVQKHYRALLNIRREQRNRQKNIEREYFEKHPDEEEACKSIYCPTCKLNHRALGGDEEKATLAHNRTKLHRTIHTYCHPKCHVCPPREGEEDSRFKTRMMYEYHISSVTHMKFKAEKAAAEEAERSEEDLDGFMTVDSVGGGDEEAAETPGEVAGSEYISEVVMQYCRLCYLTFKKEQLGSHCAGAAHRVRLARARKKAEAAEERKKAAFPRERRGSGEEEEGSEAEAEEVKPKKKQQEKEEEEGDKEAVKKEEKEEEAEGKEDEAEAEYETYNEKYERGTEEEGEDEELWEEMTQHLEEGREEEEEGREEEEEHRGEEEEEEELHDEEDAHEEEELPEEEEMHDEEEMHHEEEEEGDDERKEKKEDDKHEEMEEEEEVEVEEVKSPPRRRTRRSAMKSADVDTDED